MSSRHEGMLNQKMRREASAQFWLLFHVFPLPRGLPSVSWAGREGYMFYLRTSLLSSDIASFYFSWAFPFLVFQPPPFWTPFSCSNYLTIISSSEWKFWSYFSKAMLRSCVLCYITSAIFFKQTNPFLNFFIFYLFFFFACNFYESIFRTWRTRIQFIDLTENKSV